MLDDSTAETESAEVAPTEGGWDALRRPPSSLATAGLAAGLLLVLLLVLLIAVVRQPDTGRDDRMAALAAARQVAVDYTTYDYHHLRADFDRLKAESTGKTMLDQISTALEDGVPLLVRGKVVSEGHVLSAGVADAKDNRVAVVAAVDATVTNTVAPTGTPRRYRFQLIMTKVDGKWLVSDLQPQA